MTTLEVLKRARDRYAEDESGPICDAFRDSHHGYECCWFDLYVAAGRSSLSGFEQTHSRRDILALFDRAIAELEKETDND